jgi:aromatic-L-amino-acid decarboxylase
MSDFEFSDASRARWEWPAEEVRRVGYRVVDVVAEHLCRLPGEPVFRPFPNDRARAMLDEPLPEDGQAAEEIVDAIAAQIVPFPFGNGHPRFAGWVNGPPVVLSVLVEALAAAMNPSVAGGNHAASYVEHQVVEWLKQLAGFPRDGKGLLVSGGSAATIVALAAARHRATAGAVRAGGVDQGTAPLVVYASSQGHSAIAKAVELLGIGADNLRRIAVDDAWRIDVDALHAAIEADRGAGRRPMAVAVSAGTVNTGAIDPLAAVRALCDELGVWMHVDGAYGAPAVLDPRYRPELEPMNRADSLAMDAHKWLYVPYDAGLVLVRDAEQLRSTFSLVASYLREDSDPDGVSWLPWFSEYGPEQTRAFRALKVWAALRQHGRAGYAESIARDNRLADRLAEHAERHPELELVAHNLSVVCLRCTPPGVPADELDALNRDVLRRVQLGGEAFVSSTELNGRFVLRACIINPRATAADIDRIAEALVRAAADA